MCDIVYMYVWYVMWGGVNRAFSLGHSKNNLGAPPFLSEANVPLFHIRAAIFM